MRIEINEILNVLLMHDRHACIYPDKFFNLSYLCSQMSRKRSIYGVYRIYIFKKSNNIVWNEIYYEYRDVNVNVMNGWKPRLMDMISDYELMGDLNYDETLFYLSCRQNLLQLKKNSAGVIMSKERFIVLLFWSIVVGMEKTLAIAKTAKTCKCILVYGYKSYSHF